jgi:transcriptional regulator with XRE-family HTH domain
MTQSELAQAAGVSYQQIHKYEHGSNRISAGRLGLIAQILKIPVQIFYDGFTSAVPENGPLSMLPDGRLCLEVARNFRQIANPRYQEALHLLVRILAT